MPFLSLEAQIVILANLADDLNVLKRLRGLREKVIRALERIREDSFDEHMREILLKCLQETQRKLLLGRIRWIVWGLRRPIFFGNPAFLQLFVHVVPGCQRRIRHIELKPDWDRDLRRHQK